MIVMSRIDIADITSSRLGDDGWVDHVVHAMNPISVALLLGSWALGDGGAGCRSQYCRKKIQTASSSSSSSLHESMAEQNWRDVWTKTTVSFSAAEKVMDTFLLQANLGEPAIHNGVLQHQQNLLHLFNNPELFEPQADEDDAKGIPEAFLCFYRGELPDFVESKQSSPPNRKYKKQSYRLDLAYRGTDFCGWQTQDKHNQETSLRPAVQQLVEAALGGRDVRVAGRTDSGVHAVGQVARVRCEANLSMKDLWHQLQEASARSGSWACRRIMPVSQSFHPTFGATSRSYVYLMDADENFEFAFGDLDSLTFRLNALLAPLEGQCLPYLALSYGPLKTKTSNCTLEHARARRLKLVNQTVLAVELQGDRFLRRLTMRARTFSCQSPTLAFPDDFPSPKAVVGGVRFFGAGDGSLTSHTPPPSKEIHHRLDLMMGRSVLGR
eukprot:scaffold10377_cov150-Amphora_coffeaeformis.AAC.1